MLTMVDRKVESEAQMWSLNVSSSSRFTRSTHSFKENSTVKLNTAVRWICST